MRGKEKQRDHNHGIHSSAKNYATQRTTVLSLYTSFHLPPHLLPSLSSIDAYRPFELPSIPATTMLQYAAVPSPTIRPSIPTPTAPPSPIDPAAPLVPVPEPPPEVAPPPSLTKQAVSKREPGLERGAVGGHGVQALLPMISLYVPDGHTSHCTPPPPPPLFTDDGEEKNEEGMPVVTGVDPLWQPHSVTPPVVNMASPV